MGIEKYESGALNKLLEEFYATVRKKDREDNECDIFRVLIIAVDRYLYIYIYIYMYMYMYMYIYIYIYIYIYVSMYVYVC